MLWPLEVHLSVQVVSNYILYTAIMFKGMLTGRCVRDQPDMQSKFMPRIINVCKRVHTLCVAVCTFVLRRLYWLPFCWHLHVYLQAGGGIQHQAKYTEYWSMMNLLPSAVSRGLPQLTCKTFFNHLRAIR